MLCYAIYFNQKMLLQYFLNLFAYLKLCVLRTQTAAQKINPAISPKEITKTLHPGAHGRDKDIFRVFSHGEMRAELVQT